MKCDELKDYNIMDIEAMDDERLEESESGMIQVTRVYIKHEVDEAIAELKTENDRLKQWMKKHFYCEEMLAVEKREHKATKRALWLARANNAKLWANFWFDVFPSEYNKYDIIGRMEGNEKEFILTTLKTHRTASEWVGVWEIIDKKCRAKAKEYE